MNGRKKTNFLKFIGLIFIALLCLSGCGKKEELVSPSGCTMEFWSNGSIIVTSEESFDKDYYDKKELSQMIDDSISSYNEKAGDGSVKKRSFNVSKGKAEVSIYYASDQDYRDFNEASLYYGNLGGAGLSGIDLSSLLGTGNLSNEKKTLTSEELAKMESYSVIAVYEPMKIVTDKKMIYCTGNVTPAKGLKTAVTADTVSENEPALIILK